MCGGPERIKPSSSSSTSSSDNYLQKTMDSNGNNHNVTVETDDSFGSLLELAANNDLDGFQKLLDRDPSAIDEIGLWYGRKKGCNQMVLQHRTPLMVAATYGSLDVLNLILSVSGANVNRSSSEDKTTALHCAAAMPSSPCCLPEPILMLKMLMGSVPLMLLLFPRDWPT
ncbi:uncharacterized protein A4U43_C03F25380 [Asparagus officinalis]|uniref:Uncharacterized protein n=1 Tax=Asparagus officinalis TaxID=4686 RepID=A0A5P1FHV9_ASPOF|nr:uncharacterized protein A4U43_C03F25380 [Asparagus officinalis]